MGGSGGYVWGGRGSAAAPAERQPGREAAPVLLLTVLPLLAPLLMAPPLPLACAQVVRALHRGQNLSLRAEKAQLEMARVAVSEETPCRGCHRLLGDRVFWRYPSGVVMCGRCMQMADVAPPS